MITSDRIKELRRVPARELISHPRNWREHPPAQVAALAGLLSEIGYADALLVRQREDGRLVIIDGHLRAATTPDQRVPVLVLDVTEAEAEQILLTHDPLAAMATANEPQLRELIAATDFDHPAVAPLIASLAEQFREEAPAAELATDAEPITDAHSFQVVVDCRHEAEQAELFARLTADGYHCRLLSI